MGRKLVISDGMRERELQLVGRIVVGRDPSCDISDDHSLLSRRHAEFVTAGQSVTVRDLGSRNGVFVNGMRAAERALDPGDVVQIGPLRARYVVDDAPVSIIPEALDGDRTAMLRNPGVPPPSAVSPAVPTGMPAEPAPAPLADTVVPGRTADEDVTRMVPAPAAAATLRQPVPEIRSSHSGSRSVPLEIRPVEPVAVPDEQEVTRFTPGPGHTPEPESPAAPAATSGVAAAPPAVVITRSDGLQSFIYSQAALLAGIVLIATWLTVFLAGGMPGSTWLLLPAMVAAGAVYWIAGSISRRVGERDERTARDRG